MVNTADEYPELTKLKAISDTSQEIYDFIEGLSNKGIQLGRYTEIEGYREPQFLPIATPIDKLLAEHFGIDLDEVEREKRRMLDKLRENHARSQAQED